jgi:hypothetical protein
MFLRCKVLEKVASLFGVRGREDGFQEFLNLAVIGLQCFQYRHDTSPVNDSLVGRRVKAALFGVTMLPIAEWAVRFQRSTGRQCSHVRHRLPARLLAVTTRRRGRRP